jgi:hypothetical protein
MVNLGVVDVAGRHRSKHSLRDMVKKLFHY